MCSVEIIRLLVHTVIPALGHVFETQKRCRLFRQESCLQAQPYCIPEGSTVEFFVTYEYYSTQTGHKIPSYKNFSEKIKRIGVSDPDPQGSASFCQTGSATFFVEMDPDLDLSSCRGLFGFI
jgi:hypothetical protein